MRLMRLATAIAAINLVTPQIALAEDAKPQKPSIDEEIGAAAASHRMRIDYDGSAFSGEGWEFLLREGAEASFFLLGEEHGIAENPKFAGALFRELTKSGYGNFAVEVSPPMAGALDKAAKGGTEGLRALFADRGSQAAFFTMKEEAEMLAAVRAALPNPKTVIWGFDYEVGADRLLISMLEAKRKPAAAAKALAALRAASDASWAEYDKTGSPQYIFSFAGDPELVRAVRKAWPNADASARRIIDTLEQTFEINRLWTSGEPWASNAVRAAFMRKNFMDYRSGERNPPKLFAKFGASHMVRGRNMSEVYDIGALIPEVAEMQGEKSFNLLVLPGAGASVAVMNPSKWRYETAPPKDLYMEGIDPIVGAAYPDAFTLIDLRPLRPVVRWRDAANPEMKRIVHGFDAVLILSGSTPSTNF